jgi:hypothetical protein
MRIRLPTAHAEGGRTASWRATRSGPAQTQEPELAAQDAVAARYAGWRVKCAVTDTVAGALTMIPILFQVIP